MRYFKIDHSNWPCGVSDGLVLPCAICGKTDIRFDYVVKDEFWERVVPRDCKSDVVCLECLDELSQRAGEDLPSNVVSLQFVGTEYTIEFFPANVFCYHGRDYDLAGPPT